jgi:hypothetical protein
MARRSSMIMTTTSMNGPIWLPSPSTPTSKLPSQNTFQKPICLHLRMAR